MPETTEKTVADLLDLPGASIAPPAAAPAPAAARTEANDFRSTSDDPHKFTAAARKIVDENDAAERAFNPQFGDARNDRFKIVAPISTTRAVVGGVLLLGGVGYTGDAKAANICRGRGMEVLDRNPPSRHAPPPNKTNEAHDKKHPPKKADRE